MEHTEDAAGEQCETLTFEECQNPANWRKVAFTYTSSFINKIYFSFSTFGIKTNVSPKTYSTISSFCLRFDNRSFVNPETEIKFVLRFWV